MNISLFRAIASQYKSLRHLNTVAMMHILNHQIEDQILRHQLPVDLYAGVQKFSTIPERHHRYTQLGAICRRVYVFGVRDYAPPAISGVEFIEIPPTTTLSQEQFLLVDTPEFWVTLVAQEVEGKGPTGGQYYDGLLSYDEQVVDRISLLMSQVMEIAYEPVQTRLYNHQNRHITEINNHMLAILEQAEMTSQRRWLRTQTLQKIIELSSKNPLNLLHSAAQLLQETFQATGVAIALKTPNGQYTVPVAEGEASGKGWRMPLSEGLAGRVIQQGRMIHFLDTSHRYDGDFLLPTAKALICVPIANRQIYGSLIMGTRNAQQWDEEDAQTLQAVGRLLAIHIEQSLTISSGSSSALLLSPVKRFQKFIDDQQRAVESLLELQRKLRANSSNGITNSFLELLDQMEMKHTDLVRATRNAKTMVNQTAVDSSRQTPV
jgi:GAF domain/Sensory domain in DIguanylate Cyclases and Two-component system